MNRSNRLFEVIQILRSAKGPMTADSLAEQLEVSTRTIYRDIVALQAMGTPIDGEAGIGYIMRRGYDLPPLNFTALCGDQSVEILLGQLHSPHGFLVEIDRTRFAHGSDGIFRRFGCRNLSSDEDVQRQVERQTKRNCAQQRKQRTKQPRSSHQLKSSAQLVNMMLRTSALVKQGYA